MPVTITRFPSTEGTSTATATSTAKSTLTSTSTSTSTSPLSDSKKKHPYELFYPHNNNNNNSHSHSHSHYHSRPHSHSLSLSSPPTSPLLLLQPYDHHDDHDHYQQQQQQQQQHSSLSTLSPSLPSPLMLLSHEDRLMLGGGGVGGTTTTTTTNTTNTSTTKTMGKSIPPVPTMPAMPATFTAQEIRNQYYCYHQQQQKKQQQQQQQQKDARKPKTGTKRQAATISTNMNTNTNTSVLATNHEDRSDPTENHNHTTKTSSSSSTTSTSWNICPVSKKCRSTENPIQSIIGQVTQRIQSSSQRLDGKAPISLASGDTVAVGNIPPCTIAIDSMVQAVTTQQQTKTMTRMMMMMGGINNYAHTCGTQEARIAIAKHHSYPSSSSSSSSGGEETSRGNNNNSNNNNNGGGAQIGPESVIVTNGCSGALDIALTSLLDEGSIVLVPQPGFPLYEQIAKSVGATVIHYHLRPERQWECDIDHLHQIMKTELSSKQQSQEMKVEKEKETASLGLQSQPHYSQSPSNHNNNDNNNNNNNTYNHRVRGMVINNPSSATGSVFSEEHLSTILDFAAMYQIPIISDEIYGDMTFSQTTTTGMEQLDDDDDDIEIDLVTDHYHNDKATQMTKGKSLAPKDQQQQQEVRTRKQIKKNKFFPMAQIAARKGRIVPVITTNGISKQFLLPGWRIGWLTFHDNKYHSLWQVKQGAARLTQLNHGANNLGQAAIPALLDPTTPGIATWKETVRRTLEERSTMLLERLSKCPGLKPIPAQGGMYTTILIDTTQLDFEHDLEFAMRLVDEENIFVVPGTSMGVQNMIRLSFCPSISLLNVAASRIEQFCRRHVKPNNNKKNYLVRTE